MTSSRTPTTGFGPAIVLYAAAFVGLAWPWLSGAVTIPWDAKAQFQPELQFLAASLAHGESPFWTPNVFAGWPQIADPQSLIFSPLHLALAAFDPAPSFRAADVVTFAYLFAGGLGLILLFRERGWHPGGAVVAALILCFGGSAASRLQHTGQIISLAYVPIALWLVDRTITRASWRAGLAAGVVVALLAIGRDQVALLGLYLLAAFVVARWITGGRTTRFRASLTPLAVCGGTAFCLAVVPLVFAALLAADSNRPMIDFESAGRGSLHPAHLLMWAFADLFGAADPTVEFWGPPSAGWRLSMGPSGLFLAQNVGQIYCGSLAVVMVLGTGRRPLWGPEIRFFTLAFAANLLYALGWYTPAFRLMYDLMPGVDLFRRPADATFVAGLLLAVMTGYLVHRLMTGTLPKPRPVLAAGPIAALAVAAAAVAHAAGRLEVAWAPIATGIAFAAGAFTLIATVPRLARVRPWLATALVTGFVFADLAWNNAPNESTGLPPGRYAALDPEGGDETVALIKAKLAESFGEDRRDRVELIGIAYRWPNVSLAQGFDQLFGQNPLRLREFALATGVGDTVATPEQRTFAPLYPSYRSTFADLCGVRFIVTGVPIERIDATLHEGDLRLLGRTRDAYVYENPRALPRVMLVPRYRIVDFDAALRTGWPTGVDPRRIVLLDRMPAKASPTQGTGGAEAPTGSPGGGLVPRDGAVRLIRYENTEIDIEVDAPAGGFLVVNDAWHPWWRAEVDGRAAEILKANVLFRAVAITPGLHQVHFAFRPLVGAWDELREKLDGVM